MFDHRRITFKHLRALAAIADKRSISAASHDLNVTASAVSLQLRDLEAIVGTPLIERRPEGMEPTQAGRELLVVQQRIENAFGACEEAISALKGLESGKISVGVISTAKYFAPEALAAFLREHPGIEMNLHVGNRHDTIAVLEDYSLDFAIMGRPPAGDHFESISIGPHPHIVVAPPQHPYANRQRLKLNKLDGETFLLREAGSGTRSMFRDLLSQNGMNPSSGMEFGSNETIKQAVIAGIGVALLSAHTVAAEIETGRLTKLNVVGTPVVREWFLVKRTDRRMSPAGWSLWEFLADRTESFLPDVK